LGNLIASSFLEVNIIDCFLQKDQGKDQAVLLIWRWEGGRTGRKGQGAQYENVICTLGHWNNFSL